MLFAYTHHHYHLHRLSGFPELFVAHGLRGLAEGLAAVFIPIYLLNLGYTFADVFAYLTIYGACWALSVYPSIRLGDRIGAAKWMGLSLIGNVILFVLLITLPDARWPLALPAAVAGIYTAMYWPFFRSSFATLLAHHRTGRIVSIGNAIQTIAGGLAPAVGGIVATLFGVQAIQLVGIGLFILAAIPLLTGREFYRQQPFQVTRQTFRRHHRKFFANFAETYNDFSLYNIWPLLVFIIIPSYAGVGILSSIMIFSSILVSIYVGRREETKGVRHYLKEGSFINSVGHLLRLGVQNTGHVTGINVVGGVGYSLYSTPYNTAYYENIRRNGLGFLYGMQLFSALGVTVGGAILYGLVQFFPPRETLLIALALAIPASYGIRLMRIPPPQETPSRPMAKGPAPRPKRGKAVA